MKIPINWLKDYVELPKDLNVLTDSLTAIGHMLDKVEVVGEEKVIDLELRGNRADCYSILGIAREVSAVFGHPVRYPKLYKKLRVIPMLPNSSLSVKTAYVKRVMMCQITDIKIMPSPDWLKNKIKAYGLDSINNIVDLTNFVCVETGEPMHAFDLDKVGKNLEIRLAKKDEKITTFLGNTLSLTQEDLVWAKPGTILSVAGAIGEKFNSITDKTKSVLLEAANYDRANIRRTVYRHNLFTEAGIRHEKELDPNLVETGIYRFLYLLEVNKWGRVRPFVFDYYPDPVKAKTISFSYKKLEDLGGLKLKPRLIKQIFQRLNFSIIKEGAHFLDVGVPTFRTDLSLEEDLVEEVLRIYGYDRIPEKILSLEIPDAITPSYINQELRAREIMVSLGFDETISLPFVKEKFSGFNADPKNPTNKVVKVENFPSPDMRDMRLNLFSNLLEATDRVINERGELAMFFEIGKVYFKNKEKFGEERKLGIMFWSKEKNDFRNFKGILEALFTKLNLPEITLKHEANGMNLQNPYNVFLGKRIVGWGGAFESIYFAEIDLQEILEKGLPEKTNLWPKYPPQIEDLTIVLPPRTYLGDVVDSIKSVDASIRNAKLVDTYKDSYTFRIWYQSSKKTLEDKEIDAFRNKIISLVSKKFGGTFPS